MRLGYVDRCAPRLTMILPRERGEARAEYVARFLRAVRGLGHVHIVTIRGARRRIRATRGW